jgi:hypothetical protein
MLDREPKSGQLWSHYKHPDKLYEIKGVNVSSRENIKGLLYLAKKEETLEDLAVYNTSKSNLKLYKVKLNLNGTFKTLVKLVKKPHVIYQSKVDGVVWARLYDKFVGKVQLPYPEANWVNRFERLQ